MLPGAIRYMAGQENARDAGYLLLLAAFLMAFF